MEIEEQQERFKQFEEAYSGDFLDECLNDLKIEKDSDRIAMKAALIDAGKAYVLFDNMSKMYVPAREMRAKYNAIHKPLKKLKETWLNVWQDNIYDFSILFTRAQQEYSHNKDKYEANQLIRDFMRFGPENFYLGYGEFLHFLKFLEESTGEISNNIRGHDIKGVVPVERWLRKLKPDWEKYSPVEFTAGINYGDAVGHNSDAVVILYKLMKCMDAGTSKSRIGNTLERLIKNDWEKI